MKTILIIVELIVAIFTMAGMWKTFIKAGQHGWASIIPIYNVYILLKISETSSIVALFTALLFFIPLVNVVLWIFISFDVAKVFGKGDAFGLGLAFLGFIFFPILGFGDAKYLGEK